jgi:hypothetical protein
MIFSQQVTEGQLIKKEHIKQPIICRKHADQEIRRTKNAAPKGRADCMIWSGLILAAPLLAALP